MKRMLLARLTGQFESLCRMVDGVDAGVMDYRPADGRWSAAQQLAHLARYHEIFDARLSRILAEDNPLLVRYRAEEDADWASWQQRGSVAVLRELVRLRTGLTERLEQIPADSYALFGMHPVFGSMAMADWLEFFLVHEGHHMYAIFQRIHSKGVVGESIPPPTN